MTYEPDPRAYQQLVSSDPFGRVNCTAWSGAWAVDAWTRGARKLTGEQIRAASGEAVPDPGSPGLNLAQLDAAVHRLAGLDLDTRTPCHPSEAQAAIESGRWAVVQVDRSVLVDAGVVSGFRGGHAVTVHARDGVPVIGDPLVAHYVPTSWGLLWHAASEFAGAGHVNASMTGQPFTGLWRVAISGPTRVYDDPHGSPVGTVTKATYLCARSSADGRVCYHVRDAGAMRGKWFFQSRYTKAVPE